MHSHIRDKLENSTYQEIDKSATIKDNWSSTRGMLLKDFKSTCPIAKPGQCPYSCNDIKEYRYQGLSQGQMACTQCGFICLSILFPQAFGIHSATDEGLEAFCHVWRGIGFLLGMDDE